MDDENFKNLSLTKFDLHKILKIHDFFLKIRKLFLFLFHDVYKEKMSTIKMEDGRKAP